MRVRTRITKRLIEESMSRAIGLVVNELRLEALRKRVEKIERSIPAERIFSLTKKFIAGQFGHEPGATELTPIKVRPQRLCVALYKLAPVWNGTIAPDHVAFVINAPKRTSRR